MAVDVLLGLQWGDEGKGKITDFLAPQYDVVARFQGGPNAGHTLEFEGNKHVLHQIPSGIFRKNILNVIGNGVVLDPIIFLREIRALEPYSLPLKDQIFISKRAHLILPSHRLIDSVSEQLKGTQKIGSTLKGIGPAYQDKAARVGLRVGDIQAPDFMQKYRSATERHMHILRSLGVELMVDSEQEACFLEAVDSLREYNITDTEYLLNEIISEGKSILAEGAQGTLLDVNFGSYPYVTSSDTIAAGACTGLGIPPRAIRRVAGVFKAYCTRVGSGPFPTELHDETVEKLRKEGNEYGSTTGRPRRCGWLDLPALRYTVMVNGVSELYMMKADVLDSFSSILVCNAYREKQGGITNRFIFDSSLQLPEPIYDELAGWHKPIKGIMSYDSLDKNFQQFVSYIEDAVKIPVGIISSGPGREETIFKP